MRRRWLLWLTIVALCASCRGRERSSSGGEGGSGKAEKEYTNKTKILEFDLSGGAPESTGGGLFQLPATRTYAGLVRALERAQKQEDTGGVFVRLGTAELGWARSQEVGRLLQKLRGAGRSVVCHADSLGNSSTWLLARACDRIWLSPSGDVDSVGIAAQVVYLKGALDKLKVQADFLHVGKYKSFAETFTREGPSDAARESLTETLASIRKSWLDDVSAQRKSKQVRESLEHGPWNAEEAKSRGLIDAVGYESEALDELKQKADSDRVSVAFGPKAGGGGLDFAELVRILSGADERSGGRPHIAVVPAEGSINMASGGLLDGGGITAKALGKVLRRLAEDESTKAVVLRIDSPGGSALASDLLWHDLMLLREKKPLVVSVGDMAASGGYYMACAGNKIFAERASIVGSIGVVGGKIVVDAALAEYGINSVTFPASPEPGAAARAAYLSPLTPWDDATRERVGAQMKHIYELFLKRVAQGRKMPVDKLRPIAEGRIWSGIQGRDRGLVDEIGGLSAALAEARKLGGLDDKAPVVVEGTAEGLLEALMLGEGADAAQMSAAFSRRAAQASVFQVLPDEVVPFVSSYNPLLQSERTLTALPFALIVR